MAGLDGDGPLVALFKSPDPETASWVRIPVINYLRACPLPKAKEYIAELRKIDPQAVEQSETLYPIGPASDGGGDQPGAGQRVRRWERRRRIRSPAGGPRAPVRVPLPQLRWIAARRRRLRPFPQPRISPRPMRRPSERCQIGEQTTGGKHRRCRQGRAPQQACRSS